MGRRRLPYFKRYNILLLYVKGFPYREIAHQVLVSVGTVSNVVADLRTDDNVSPLSRVLALELRKNGQDLADYAQIIKTRNHFKNRGIAENTCQKIAIEIAETCFRMFIPVEQFVKDVEAFIEFSKKYAKDNPKQVVEYVNSQVLHIHGIKEVIKKLEIKKAELKAQCENVGMNFLYLMKNPDIKNLLLAKDKQFDEIRHQRDQFKRERDDLKEKLEAKTGEPYEFKVTHPGQKIIELIPAGIRELNRKLAIPVTSEDIFFKLEDIAIRPYAYLDLFIKELAVNEDLHLELNSNPPERTTEDGKPVLK